MASIPFFVEETGGIARDGGTLSSMTDPVCVPIAWDDAQTSAATWRVWDVTANQAVPAAFRTGRSPLATIHSIYEGGTRWGDVGNAAHRIRTALVDLQPVLNSGEKRNYRLDFTGGTGDTTAAPLTVTDAADYYEINTGPNGIKARVPRRGAQCILSYLECLNASGQPTGKILINGPGGGLWCAGVATANDIQSTPNTDTHGDSQARDYFSRLDTTNQDGGDNGGTATENAGRPGKYYTSKLFANSMKCGIKIDNIRLRSTGNGDFCGQNVEVVCGQSPVTTSRRIMVCDVLLWFYRGSRAIQIEVWNKGSQGTGGVSTKRSDIALDGFGIEFALTWQDAATTLKVRDETLAAPKIRTVTAGTSATLRQLKAPVLNGSYNFTWSKSGGLGAVGGTTHLESVLCAIKPDGTMGLAVMPRHWREKNPQGYLFDAARGVVRWELLNPIQTQSGHVQTSFPDTARPYHVLIGSKWMHQQAWLVAFDTNPSDQVVRDTTRALAGRCEYVAGTYPGGHVDTTGESEQGTQQLSLLGGADANAWDRARSWRRIRPASTTTSRTFGSTSLLSRPGQWALTGTRIDKYVRAAWHDTAAIETFEPGITGCWRWRQSLVYGFDEMGFWSWQDFGCRTQSLNGADFGANNYEYASYPLYHWMALGDHDLYNLSREAAFHHIGVDQHHSLPSEDLAAGSFPAPDTWPPSRCFHGAASNFFGAWEYQQQAEDLPLWAMLSGHPLFIEACQHYLNLFVYARLTGGNPDAGSPLECTVDTTGILSTPAPSQGGQGEITNIVGGTANIQCLGTGLNYANRLQIIPPDDRPAVMGETISSSGDTITFSVALGPPFWGLAQYGTQAEPHGAAGAELQVISGAHTGQIFKVIQYLSPSSLRVTPTPSPAIAAGTRVQINWRSNAAIGTCVVLSKTPTSFTFYTRYGLYGTAGRTVRIRAPIIGSIRAEAWPLAWLIGVRKVLGATFGNDQLGAINTDLYIRNSVRRFLYTEQVASSTGSKNQMGGCGDWPTSGCNNWYGDYHGIYCWTNSTAHAYGIGPLLFAHELMEQCATYAIDGGVYTSTERDNLLDLMDRWCRTTFTGVDGKSPLRGGTRPYQMTLNRIPLNRGGYLASPTSYQYLGSPMRWSLSPEPGRAGRTREDFLGVVSQDLNDLTRDPLLAADQYEANLPFNWLIGAGGTPQYGPGIGAPTVTDVSYGSDALAYVALVKWNNKLGDHERANLWLDLAMEAWANLWTVDSMAQFVPMWDYVNPGTIPKTIACMVASGQGYGEMALNWGLKSGAYVMRLAAEGFPGTGQPPTETQALAQVSKTSSEITVNGPAAQGGTAPLVYRFYKDGTPDGPDQSSTQYTYRSLAAGTAYHLKRRAVDANGLQSGDSNELVISTETVQDTTPPNTPPTFAIAGKTANSLTWGWGAATDPDPNPSGIKSYLLSIDNGADIELLAPTTSYTATFGPNETHGAKVRAKDNANLLSPYTAVVSDTTLPPDTTVPAVPTSLGVAPLSSTTASVGWAPNTEADIKEYDVARATVDATVEPHTVGSLVFLGTVQHPTVSYTDAGPLTPLAYYAYAARARDTSGNTSDYSTPVEIRIPRYARHFAPGPPQQLLFCPSVPFVNYPFTVSLWAYADDIRDEFLWAASKWNADFDYAAIKLVTSGGRFVQALRVQQPTVPGYPTAQTTTQWDATQWFHVAAVFASATDCRVYLNGAGEGSNTTSVPFWATTHALDTMTLGANTRATLTGLPYGQPQVGGSTDLAIWDSALTPALIAMLASGQSPRRVSRTNLIYYNPVIGTGSEVPQIPTDGTGTLTSTGWGTPTTMTGPAIEYLTTDPNLDTFPPSVPGNRRTTALGSRTWTIAWDASVDEGTNGVGGYRIRGANLTVIAFVPANTLTYQFTGLSPNTPYRATVSAVDTGNYESPESLPLIERTLTLRAGSARSSRVGRPERVAR